MTQIITEKSPLTYEQVRQNKAVKQADLQVDMDKKDIALHLTIDTEVCPISEYFEIFLSRMLFAAARQKSWALSSN